MNLKKTWTAERGRTAVITRENSSLVQLETDMLRLETGDEVSFAENGKDFAVIILEGKVRGACGGRTFGLERGSVFDGPADSLFLPRGVSFTVRAEAPSRVAVAKSPAERDFEPKLVKGQDARRKTLGKGSYVREASFLIEEAVPCNRFYIGEFWVKDGNWASWPPHKHDEDNMPTEGQLEEIYYFEFDKPSGCGVQMVYSKEGDLDELYRVKSGDFVEIPKGYHPFACAPGYTCYCLWIMGGKDRGIFCTTEEGHRWQNSI